MKRICNKNSRLTLLLVLALWVLSSSAKEVNMILLLKNGSVPGFVGDITAECKGDLGLEDLGLASNNNIDISLLFSTKEDYCDIGSKGADFFNDLPDADNIPLKISYSVASATTAQPNASPFIFDSFIIKGKGSIKDSAISVVVSNQSDDNSNPSIDNQSTDGGTSNDPNASPKIIGAPCPTAVGDPNNKPGSGFFSLAECPGLIIFDGNNSQRTEIPGCIQASPSTPPNQCRGFESVEGHETFAQRLEWADLSGKEAIGGIIQASTIDTMIGQKFFGYKGVIISISDEPGDFNTSNNCRDVNPSEISSVVVLQEGSDFEKENRGRYCALQAGGQYYINVRFDGGKTVQCGEDITCQLTIIEDLPV